MCDLSKQGQAIQEDYRATVRKEGKLQKDKAELKMKLASNISDLQKGFFLSMLIARGCIRKMLNCYWMKLIT